LSTPSRRNPRAPRRSPLWRPVLAALGLLALLLLGISIGRALEDGPSPGGTQTNVRTLTPQPLPPAARTVTVTITTG
jgi:hypothetical protein